MSKRDPPPPLHSLAEACLYLRVTPCPVCAGPLDCEQARFEHDSKAGRLSVSASCRTCGADFDARFDASGVPPEDWRALRQGRIEDPWVTDSRLNNADEPSGVIDLAGWLKLFTLISDAARSAAGSGASTGEREQSRRMRLLAGACLDEALKFFEEDNDLPPDDAFFAEPARRQFWERPELFTRQHIADLRFSLLRSSG